MELPVLPTGREDNVLFLCKSMESQFLESTIKEGKFCFNHPTIFNEWKEKESAQYDKWDAHATYELSRIVVNPPVDAKKGKPDLEAGIQIPVKGELHLQNNWFFTES